MRYLKPVFFDDRVRIHARCVDVRGSRFRYEYALERDGEIVADGWTHHAVVNRGTFRPTRVPAWLAERDCRGRVGLARGVVVAAVVVAVVSVVVAVGVGGGRRRAGRDELGRQVGARVDRLHLRRLLGPDPDDLLLADVASNTTCSS